MHVEVVLLLLLILVLLHLHDLLLSVHHIHHLLIGRVVARLARIPRVVEVALAVKHLLHAVVLVAGVHRRLELVIGRVREISGALVNLVQHLAVLGVVLWVGAHHSFGVFFKAAAHLVGIVQHVRVVELVKELQLLLLLVAFVALRSRLVETLLLLLPVHVVADLGGVLRQVHVL